MLFGNLSARSEQRERDILHPQSFSPSDLCLTYGLIASVSHVYVLRPKNSKFRDSQALYRVSFVFLSAEFPDIVLKW